MTPDASAQPYEEGDKKTDEDVRAERWEAFAQAICTKRKEAIDARRESGIEDVWALCEEHYAGIDDTNRHEFRGGYSGNAWTKPTQINGPMTRDVKSKGTTANGFVRMTARYVDAGAAKLGEVTIPIDGKVFSLKSTPVPEALAMSEDDSPVMVESQPGLPPEPAMRPPQPGEEVPEGQQQMPLTVKDLAKHQLEKAETAAEKAETRIHDWLIECSHPAQLRKVEFDMARLGVGVLKGPTPEKRRAVAASKSSGALVIEAKESTKPGTRRVNPWNFFPDGVCGDCIQDGDFVFERDFLSPSRLEDLKSIESAPGVATYMPEMIDKVLAEGPEKTLLEPEHQRTTQAKRKQFVVWYFYGRVSVEELEQSNPAEYEAQIEGGADPKSSIYAIVTLVNDTPIRVTVAPLELSKEYPYHVASWRSRDEFWAGVGPAEQLIFPQKLINSATRAGMSNAAKSAGGILAVDNSALEPSNGSWAIVPDMTFIRADDSSMNDVRAAIAVFQIPNVTDAMMKWIEYAFRLAEESTNIPLITQGQSGKYTPDTFSGQQLQDNNAMQLLRDVGYSVAENISNPLTRQLYEWLLLDPDVPDDEKGDAQIDANAAVALVEKALQDQALMLMYPLVQDPECGFDKRAYAKTSVRMRRLNPDDVMLSDEEFDKRSQQPPPPLPQVQVAQINAKSRETVAQSRDHLAAQRNQNDLDRDAVYAETERQKVSDNSAARIEELRLKRDLAMLEYAKDERLSLQDAKVKLAGLSMELGLQRELAGKDGKGPQVATPKVEPEGRAADGTAYQA